jgi:hypothetical protein
MAFNSNFELIRIDDGGLFVSGSSDPMSSDGLTLTRREVEIVQGDSVARGTIPLGLKWQGTVPSEDRFDRDRPVAVTGTETYSAAVKRGIESASATFTWKQTLKLAT